jgi:YfiH family protein
LLLDTRRKVATAVHAGWKGTLSRITRKVLTVLKRELRTEPSDLFVALGPAIGPCCYEVDENVLAPFRANFPRAASFIVGPAEREQSRAACHVSPAQDSEKGFESNCGNMSQTVPSRKGLPSRRPYRLDLIGANRFELIAEGVPESNIHIIGLCTSCRPDLFFSHRRDAGRTGRHIAIAGFRK